MIAGIRRLEDMAVKHDEFKQAVICLLDAINDHKIRCEIHAETNWARTDEYEFDDQVKNIDTTQGAIYHLAKLLREGIDRRLEDMTMSEFDFERFKEWWEDGVSGTSTHLSGRRLDDLMRDYNKYRDDTVLKMLSTYHDHYPHPSESRVDDIARGRVDVHERIAPHLTESDVCDIAREEVRKHAAAWHSGILPPFPAKPDAEPQGGIFVYPSAEVMHKEFGKGFVICAVPGTTLIDVAVIRGGVLDTARSWRNEITCNNLPVLGVR